MTDVTEEAKAGLLAGLRVVEAGTGIAGSFAASIYAGLGAYVTKIEPTKATGTREIGPFAALDAESEQSAASLMLDRCKTSRILDLDQPIAHVELHELLAGADLLVDTMPLQDREALGLDEASTIARFPNLVHVSITPFGTRGPYAGRPGNAIISLALSGVLWISGEPDKSPLSLPFLAAEEIIGTTAFTASMAAIFASPSPRGEFVDIAEIESLATLHENALAMYTNTSTIKNRRGNHTIIFYQPWTLLPCADGWIGVIAPPRKWDLLCHWMDRPDLIEDERFATPALRVQNVEALDREITAFTSQHTKRDLYESAQPLGLPIGPVLGPDEVLEDSALNEAEYFVAVPCGDTVIRLPDHPVRIPDAPWGTGPSAPPGARDYRRPAVSRPAQSRPLAGIRIVDMGIAWAGALCGRMLAELGAEVILIESRRRMEWRGSARPQNPGNVYPDNEFGQDPWNRYGLFNERHRGKLSLTLELDTSPGRRTLRDLIARSDVLAENFTVRVLENLGLTWDELSSINPRLIMVSMAGFGHTGPERNNAAFGPTMEHMSGFTEVTGYRHTPPGGLGLPWTDPVVGMFGAGMVIAALRRREETGKGLFVDVAQRDFVTYLGGYHLAAYQLSGRPSSRLGNRHPLHAPQGCYECQRGTWLAISVTDASQFTALAQIIGEPDWIDAETLRLAVGRQAHHDALDARIRIWCAGRDADEAAAQLQTVGVPSAALSTTAALFSDPQLESRRFFQTIEHPSAGTRRLPRAPWLFSMLSNDPLGPAPRLGEHNHRVLREVLDYSSAQVADLASAGVIGNMPIV